MIRKGITSKEKKILFLNNYKKNLNITKALEGYFSLGTFYRYIKEDKKFAEQVDEIESKTTFKAEESLINLLNSEDDNVIFKTATYIINSKKGKKHARYIKEDKSDVQITTNEINYKINED